MNAIGIYLECIDKNKKEIDIFDIPVLRDFEYQCMPDKQTSVQESRQVIRKNGIKNGIQKVRRRQLAPLSAYCAFVQRPLSTSGRFSEFDVEELIVESNLNYIRNLGYNNIRPIGIGNTLGEMQVENGSSVDQAAMTSQQTNIARIEIENDDEIFNPSGFNNVAVDLDEDIHSEQEDSYNFDDEFDRVEEETGMEARSGERGVVGTGGFVETPLLRQEEDSLGISEAEPSVSVNCSLSLQRYLHSIAINLHTRSNSNTSPPL